MSQEGELRKVDIIEDRDRQSERVYIRTACQELKRTLRRLSNEDNHDVAHQVLHPPEARLMTVGGEHQEAASEFYHAVWQASYNSDNMPRMTIVHNNEEERVDAMNDVNEQSPNDRSKHHESFSTLQEVKPNSQSAVFLPFTMDQIQQSRIRHDAHVQFLVELRKTLRNGGIVFTTTDSTQWLGAAKLLGYNELDMPSDDTEKYKTVLLQKNEHMPIEDATELLGEIDFPVQQMLFALSTALELWSGDREDFQYNLPNRAKALERFTNTSREFKQRLERIKIALPSLGEHAIPEVAELYQPIQESYHEFMDLLQELEGVDKILDNTKDSFLTSENEDGKKIATAEQSVLELVRQQRERVSIIANNSAYMAYRAITKESDRRK